VTVTVNAATPNNTFSASLSEDVNYLTGVDVSI